ncbi:MerR family DNA-binding protein [Leisingera daeponensis]|uniref:MerR family DNA-binding protein n=1 Tax=Leisingera daeponensis TaxID=405746 RepID=UPI0028F6ED1C|nr:MerR family DNA-binding protein [Leisingera daeponensis]
MKGLLGLVDGGTQTCGEVKALTERHLSDVRQKLQTFGASRKSLQQQQINVPARMSRSARFWRRWHPDRVVTDL